MRLRTFGVALLVLATACGGEPTTPSASPPRTEGRAAAASRLGYPLTFENDLGMRFVLIPEGEMEMGGEAAGARHPEEAAAHAIRIVTPFYLQASEVTRSQFAAFASPDGTPDPGERTGADEPAEVTWAEAREFVAWLGTRDPRWIHRLPTEAEWEFACRAGGPLDEPTAGATHPWGLARMHLGGPEWCRDWYGPYPDWSQDDPQGPSVGRYRVVRGGDVAGGPPCSTRATLDPEDRATFRIAVELSYGRNEHGAHRVTFHTFDPRGAPGDDERPGYALKMISVPGRLRDRQNGLDPRWTALDGRSPLTVPLPPGRYYVYAWRDDRESEWGWVRGLEVKFDVPVDSETLRVPIPR